MMARKDQARPQSQQQPATERIAASARLGRRCTTITISRGPMAASVNPWSSLTKTRGSAHQHRGPHPAPDQRGQRAGQQRHGEGDLVEVVVDHLLQAPGEAVSGADRAARSGPELVRRRPADRHHGHRGEQGLRHQQGDRGREDPEERGDQRDDGMEVVPEQVEARAPDVDDRRVQVGVLLDVLGEDAQVPGRRGRAAGTGTARSAGTRRRPPGRSATAPGPDGWLQRGARQRPRAPAAPSHCSAGAGQWLRLTAAGRDHALLAGSPPAMPPCGLPAA